MGFIDAIKTCLSKYFTFSGRASRSEFWWFYLFATLIGLIPIVGAIGSLALLVPTIAATVRRLHDIDKSGWWVLGLYGILICLGILGALLGGSGPVIVAVVVVGLVVVVIGIVWLATKGTEGPNRFGDDPFGIVNKDVFS